MDSQPKDKLELKQHPMPGPELNQDEELTWEQKGIYCRLLFVFGFWSVIAFAYYVINGDTNIRLNELLLRASMMVCLTLLVCGKKDTK